MASPPPRRQTQTTDPIADGAMQSAHDNTRWRAVTTRDATADGEFLYAVRTTGVFCRPSCKARTPRRENVTFHATAQDARDAGHRPCKRCAPEDPPRAEREAALVASICALIAAADETPALADLARAVSLSPFHVQRLFKRVTGLTPRGYASALKAQRMTRSLAEAPTVTTAIHDAGYGSSSRFYETSTERLGMAPSTWRGGGATQTLGYAFASATLGDVLVAATARGIAAILIGNDRDTLLADLRSRFPKAELVADPPGLATLAAEAVAAVELPEAAGHLPLDVRGTAFQERVWQELRRVPGGETITYAELARRIGRPAATRAVASACGANPLAVVVPCHRVIRGDGSLGGYRWGLDRKRALLAREKERVLRAREKG